MPELLFINFSLSDLIDILLVAFLIYTLYKLVKGTVAINIFVGIAALYFIWKLVSFLKMRMLDEILGQFLSVGVLALIIVFQQEIRSFLLMLGKIGTEHSEYLKIFRKNNIKNSKHLNHIIPTIQNLSKDRTGALIVIKNTNELREIIDTGEYINANLSSPLLESIFFKNNPLHDGAVIISKDKIEAARCVLPLSKKTDFPADYGLRHRAAVGLTQSTDALCIIVSEQTGKFSYSRQGKLYTDVQIDDITKIINTLEGKISSK